MTSGANRISEVGAAQLADLNSGHAEARTLTEALAIDHLVLLAAVIPNAPAQLVSAVAEAQSLGILKRMAAIGSALKHHLSSGDLAALAIHPSDTVRGWWCFATASSATDGNAALLAACRPLADDNCFTVREWVWMAARPKLVTDLEESIALLTPWTSEPSANLRRFASESLRPRGVWASHIAALKTNPALGEPLLEPLRSDPSRYVQDSVANWINDASKTSPEWAKELCSRWSTESTTPETARITSRALRSLK
ncbi:DNA alkylation repair protein [Leucobacter insecticola]|uniref:DNA alkylation repair protein n=1 Tax=Leucobacter insecticola TaxID=2714934 RepID=A0A6G8FHU8_9MICO|nr:DNA alkylation repair protein [Leucobacter insecticola]QIM15612.1 DNA alkylation repair protein [Leucobacter insecticola]